eukprot:jgi/Botrbrau1/6056/Bobra.0042s0036.1
MAGLTLVRAAVLIGSAVAVAGKGEGFIRACGNKFVDGSGGDFIPIGWNSWVTLNRQATAVAGGISPGGDLGSNYVTNVFDVAKANGFNIVRIFGHGEETSFELQTDPGVYDEGIFRGFDYILAVAASRGIKVLFVPINNWLSPYVGDGKSGYLTWAGISDADQDDFWTDPTAKQMVKNHYRNLMTRTNVFTGKQWKDDPTFFAFDLYNEHRCPGAQDEKGSCPGPVTSWINEMACYLKGLAPNIMLTVGEEGFFGYNSGKRDADPWGIPDNVKPLGRYWSASVGQDFKSQHAGGCIDFAAFHMWVDNWSTIDSSFPPIWIEAHIDDARSLGKPLLLEEFGKRKENGDNQVSWYEAVYSAVLNSIENGDNLRGAMFWRWAEDGGTDSTTVYTGDQSFSVVKKYADLLEPHQGAKVC